MTYEQRVQHMAEKMADRYISADHVIKERRGDAKIAVAAQAEGIREFASNYSNYPMSVTEEYLIENGYIITSTTNVEQPSNPLPVSPDNENAYEKEVRRIAQILARWRYRKEFIGNLDDDDANIVWDRFDDRLKEAYINSKLEESRVMVAEMYTIYQYGHVDGMLHEQYSNRPCEDTAKFRGLIPSPETKHK